MALSRETQIYREDERKRGTLLNPAQREDLVKPYLPEPVHASRSQTSPRPSSKPVRKFLQTQLHVFVFVVMHTVFSIYIRIRQTYHISLDRIFAILYYHHRAPELIRQDVKNLTRIPQHLSVIVELKEKGRGLAGLEALIEEVAELSAWCTCAGIPMLSVYEKTGTSKMYNINLAEILTVRRRTQRKSARHG